MTYHFPKPFVHDHPPIQNVNDIIQDRLTFGQKAADRIAQMVGSWRFIIIQSCLLAAWAAVNVVAWTHHWDPLSIYSDESFLSLQAAYTAPMIMMSQNRQNARDRVEAHVDYLTNQKAEVEIRAVLDHLAAQDQALAKLIDQVSTIQKAN